MSGTCKPIRRRMTALGAVLAVAFGPVAGVVTLDRDAGRGDVRLRIPTAGVDTGLPVFDAWRVTTSACRKHWLALPTWRSQS